MQPRPIESVFGSPATPHELIHHCFVNLHTPRAGGLYKWEIKKPSRAVTVRVDGTLIFNDVATMR
ncbi:MAG: hypothetical protein KGQ79_11665 [Proteobacteria bacterium]|nr:hypothetical protein [Pseudomonadota bacterium]